MQTIGRIFLSALFGAIAGGAFGFLNFFILMQLDNHQFGESFGFSLVAGMACAAIGFFIGLTIGTLDLGMILGGLVGLLAVTVAIGFFVVLFGTGGNQSSIFRANWRVLLIFLTIPLVLSGVATALLKNLIYRTQSSG